MNKVKTNKVIPQTYYTQQLVQGSFTGNTGLVQQGYNDFYMTLSAYGDSLASFTI